MANTLLNSTIILNKSLEILHNNLTFTKCVNRQYDDQFKSTGTAGKPGTTLYVRKPVQHTVSSSVTLNLQDLVEQDIAIACATRCQDSFVFSTQDLTMNIDDFANRYLKTGMARIAAAIDAAGLALYKDVYNYVGTPGTTPASQQVYLDGGAVLDYNCCPRDGERYAVIDPSAQAKTVGGLASLFNNSSKISSQYDKGSMGDALGYGFRMDQLINTHTCGSRTGTILVDDLAGTYLTEGSTSLHIDGLGATTQTFKDGDIFTVAAVYDVNPETKDTLSTLKRFVVTADATAASSEVTLAISPAMYTSASGALQNISAMPANDAAVTVVGTASTGYPQNMLFHRDAFTLVTADLEMPKGVDFAARDVADGISMRIVRDYSIVNDTLPCRIDVLYGWTSLRPEWACRLWG
jgi:hypothetical protein